MESVSASSLGVILEQHWAGRIGRSWGAPSAACFDPSFTPSRGCGGETGCGTSLIRLEKQKRGEPWPRRRVSRASGESPRGKYPLVIWVTVGAFVREDSSLPASWRGRQAWGAKGSMRPRFPLPAGAAHHLPGTDPAPGRRLGCVPQGSDGLCPSEYPGQAAPSWKCQHPSQFQPVPSCCHGNL